MQAVCLFASDIMLVIAKDTIFTMESFNPCLVPRIVPHGLIGLIRNKVKVHGVITTRANNVIILVLHGGTHIRLKLMLSSQLCEVWSYHSIVLERLFSDKWTVDYWTSETGVVLWYCIVHSFVDRKASRFVVICFPWIKFTQLKCQVNIQYVKMCFLTGNGK